MLMPRGVLLKSDAICVPTGNGFERTEFAAKLFKAGWANVLVMSGSSGSRVPREMKKHARKLGVPGSQIIIEGKSSNTKQNMENLAELARKNNWKHLIVITSPHTALRTNLYIRKHLRGFKVINYPIDDFTWWSLVESSRNPKKRYFRWMLIITELWRIAKYRLKGDL